MSQHDLMPAPAAAPQEDPELAERVTRQSSILLTICLSAVVAALAIVARFTPQAPARPLIFPVERQVSEEHAPLAVSITPITAVGDAASGMQFSGDGYDVACTVSAATATLYPAVHNGTAWSVLWQFPCALDGAVLTKPTCIFPARRESGNTWNVFKTGAATVNACTAVQRFGPIPAARPSAGGGAPAAHAATHENGGADEVALDASQITGGTLAEARLPTGIDAAKVADGTVTNAEFQRLDATSSIQTQLDSKLATGGAGTAVTDVFAGFVFTAGVGSITAGVQYMGGPGANLAGSGGSGVFTAPISGLVAGNLGCEVDTAPGGAETATFTLMESADHGASYNATILTCTMTGATQTCADGGPVGLNQLARYAVRAQGSAGTAAANATCSFRVSK